LANHPEPGQTFAGFARSGFHRPDATRRRIYLQPIGDFAPETSPAIADLRECAQAFFQLPVQVLDGLDPADGELTTRMHPQTGKPQVLAPDVLAWLQRRLPADAYCVLGVTMLDLYPEPSWNFVFGMASTRERTGVFSFARYDPAFAGQARGADFQATLLRRSCKVLTHEASHMFGLLHCVHYECGLNGSNHLAESDSRPIHLCPVCLRKLQHAVGFDVLGRYRALEVFYSRVGLAPEARWVHGRIARIED
jgi:archaemetzincin